MSREQKRNANINIDFQTGKHASEIFNRSQRVNTFDKIGSLLADVKSKHQSSEPDIYYGLILYSNKIDLEFLSDRYGTESRIYNDIIKQHTAKDSKSKGDLYECIVHIPEITGMLPWPDFTKIQPALLDPANFSSSASAVVTVEDFERMKQNYPKVFSEAFPEVIKLSLYPRFYYYSDKSGQPAMYNMCKVKFTSASPTRGIGIFLEQLSEYWYSFN